MLTVGSPLAIFGAEPMFWIFAIIMPLSYFGYMKRYGSELTYIHIIIITVLGAAGYTIMCVIQFVPHTSFLWLVVVLLCVMGVLGTHKHAMQR